MISGCATYRAGVALPDTDTPLTAMAALASGHGRTTWIGLSNPAIEESQRLSQLLGLDQRASRTLEESSTTAGLDYHDGSLHLTVGVASYDQHHDLVEIGGLSMLVRENLVVTVTHHTDPAVRDLRRSLEIRDDVLSAGPAGIVLAHMEAVVGGYDRVLGDLRADVEALEREVFSETPTTTATQRIYLLKREAIDFQQASAALLDPLDDLADGKVGLMDSIQPLEWAALRDSLARLVDRADGVSNLLSGILTAYQTDVALRQNEDMRKISAWVAIAAVPTMLAGIYGMNFENMPELQFEYGYAVILVVMAATSVGLYMVFRTRNWL